MIDAVRNLYPILGPSRADHEERCSEGCVTCRHRVAIHEAKFITGVAHPGRCFEKAIARREPIDWMERATGIVTAGSLFVLAVGLVVVPIMVGIFG